MADPLEIIREDKGDRGAYRALVPGTAKQAELTWQLCGDVRVADHTFTPPEARGLGIAGQLVEAMIADARAMGFRIVPQCPYVAVQFDKHPEWAELRA